MYSFAALERLSMSHRESLLVHVQAIHNAGKLFGGAVSRFCVLGIGAQYLVAP